jgi:hypothetical protein
MKWIVVLLLCLACSKPEQDTPTTESEYTPKFKVGDCILYSFMSIESEFSESCIVTIINKVNKVGKKSYLLNYVSNTTVNVTLDLTEVSDITYTDAEYILVSGKLCGDN